MVTQMIVGDQCEIIEFKIINVHGESLLNVLFYKAVYQGIRFPAAGISDNDVSTDWGDYRNSAIAPRTFIVIFCREVYRVFIIQKLRFLFETFILIVERIFDSVSFE